MITYATLTKIGGRKVNEDSVGVRQTSGRILCVLADGLGGHNAGEIASALAVENALKHFIESTVPFDEMLSSCMNKAQEEIIKEQHKRNKIDEMKTTAVMLLIDDNRAQWAHVGDSRLYIFENSEVAGRTLDHSVPQMLALQGEIKEKEIRYHEDRNRLTRAMGAQWDNPKYVLSEPVDLPASTSFLLCSDGFWEMIEEKEMSRCLKKSSEPEQWLFAMEKIVLRNGKKKNMDNYSAIAIFVSIGKKE